MTPAQYLNLASASSQSIQEKLDEMIHRANHPKEQMEGWLEGLKKMWTLFNRIRVNKPYGWNYQFMIPSGNEVSWDFYEIDIDAVCNWLEQKFNKGYWSVNDRIPLNYLRELYFLNQNWKRGDEVILKVENWKYEA